MARPVEVAGRLTAPGPQRPRVAAEPQSAAGQFAGPVALAAPAEK